MGLPTRLSLSPPLPLADSLLPPDSPHFCFYVVHVPLPPLKISPYVSQSLVSKSIYLLPLRARHSVWRGGQKTTL